LIANFPSFFFHHFFFHSPHFGSTFVMAMKRKTSSDIAYPPVFGPIVKQENDHIWEILPLETVKTELPCITAPNTSRRFDSRLPRTRCDLAYDSGCTCKDCIKKWRQKPTWKRGPRCIMCPLLIKRDLGDGVCCGYCKKSLLEVQKYPFSGKGPNGEPVFKKSYYGERRNDKL